MTKIFYKGFIENCTEEKFSEPEFKRIIRLFEEKVSLMSEQSTFANSFEFNGLKIQIKRDDKLCRGEVVEGQKNLKISCELIT
jgi:hypothetical protein